MTGLGKYLAVLLTVICFLGAAGFLVWFWTGLEGKQSMERQGTLVQSQEEQAWPAFVTEPGYKNLETAL